MTSSILFNNKNSYDDFGIVITNTNSFDPTEQVYYDCAKEIEGNFNIRQFTKQITEWIYNASSSYSKLYDDYHPSWFRYATPVKNLTFKRYDSYVTFTLTFDCDPYMYSNDGQLPISYTSGNPTIYNQGSYKSLPYIKIYGSDDITFSVNDISYDLYSVSSYIEIDCERMICYKGATLCNEKMSALNGMPYFVPGKNVIKILKGTVTKIDIVPRWRCP